MEAFRLIRGRCILIQVARRERKTPAAKSVKITKHGSSAADVIAVEELPPWFEGCAARLTLTSGRMLMWDRSSICAVALTAVLLATPAAAQAVDFGKYDVLEIETRFLKNPRGYDTTGIPFHADGKTVIKERIYLDKADPNVLWNEITVIDNALTRPYSKKQRAERNPDPHPTWKSDSCSEYNAQVP